ncbi:hypothetical protein V6N11_015811 [Hibiscus sabdariffa]|uniref:Uncharacterized protein n=1 Tax=Hibiscus sabdariffa TaxID=183260 RepID=A0ABR2TTH4_9ROSI
MYTWQNKSGTGGLVIVKTNGETPQLSVVHNHSLELGSNRVMEDGGEVKYSSDSFSKLLVQVSWSDTKLISQLAFLCNIKQTSVSGTMPLALDGYCKELLRGHMLRTFENNEVKSVGKVRNIPGEVEHELLHEHDTSTSNDFDLDNGCFEMQYLGHSKVFIEEFKKLQRAYTNNLRIWNVVKLSAIQPVIAHAFCGNQKILDALWIDENHVHYVMMHRDIVPRAFSCKYLNHVAVVLERLPGSLRFHPSNKKKLLCTPLEKLFILQPRGKSSPPHPLVPPGNALYALDKAHPGYLMQALT